MIKQIFQFLNNIFFFLKRKANKADDPLEQNRVRTEQIDKDIAKGDSKQATLNASADLDELDRLQKYKDDPDRPGRSESKKG